MRVSRTGLTDSADRCSHFRFVVFAAGIPVNQQSLIFNDRELTDELEMRDIPLVKGSRLKFVLGMKGGPVSARRSVTLPADCDSWFDLNDMNPR